MKKSLVTTLILCIVFAATTVVAKTSETFNQVNYNITIGNDIVEMQYPTYINSGRMYVSLRSICEKLGVPIGWNNEKKQAEIDVYNKNIIVSDKTPFREEGVISDEETALVLGKIILEKYAGKLMEYETDERVYYLEAFYEEDENAWIVMQTFRFKNSNGVSSIDQADWAHVKLNKNTGEVMYINTYATYTD